MFYRTAVIIVNWNNHEDTTKCIDSLKQSKTPCKIIVVDNASDKNDVERLNQVERITLIKNAENLGFGRGNNVGIRWALINTDCKFIFLLNNDATVKEDTISKLEVAMDAHHEAGVVTPRIVLSENPNMLWYGGGEVSWGKGGAKIPGYMGPADAKIALIEREVTFASGCAMLIRRPVLEKVGGFDPRFFMYEEDLELCLRICDAGWRIVYIPDALVLHKVQGSRRKNGIEFLPILHPCNPKLPFYFYQITKNKLLTFSRHAKGIRLLQFWFFFTIYWALKCIQFLMNKRWDAIFAMAKGIREFFSIYKHPFINELNPEGWDVK